MTKKMYTLLMLVFTLTVVVDTKAQGLIDGFVDEMGALSISTTYSRSTFDHAFVGKDRLKLNDPGLAGVLQDRLNQDVYSLFAKYMINAKLSALINIPYIIGTGEGRADFFNEKKRVSGVQDITLGIRYNIHNFEFENSELVVLSGLTTSIPTNYEPNGFLSMGSGALAVDFTAGLQYQTYSGFFSTVTVAYSVKDDLDTRGVFTNIPNSFLAGAKFGYSTRSIYISGWFDMAKASSSGVDVTLVPDQGFNLNTGNLPETRVDYVRAGVNIQKTLTRELKFGVGYGRVLNGRNVGQSNIYTAGLTYLVQLL